MGLGRVFGSDPRTAAWKIHSTEAALGRCRHGMGGERQESTRFTFGGAALHTFLCACASRYLQTGQGPAVPLAV